MRVAFYVLLLANLVILVWGRDYEDARNREREPERFEQQLAPEKLRFAPPAAAQPATEPISPADR